ncbi:MAG: response regulator, partial [Ignavibacteriales bacterium]|nr:response regulator [Ignavibacteriales bacterium]
MKKVLIVEDEESMRLGLGDNLKFDGYNVDFAEDGEKGLNKIRENKYNLILLDIMLPKISGFEVCKTIRKEGVKTPVIMLTAKGEEIDKVLGLEIGADDYITKPFSLRE